MVPPWCPVAGAPCGAVAPLPRRAPPCRVVPCRRARADTVERPVPPCRRARAVVCRVPCPRRARAVERAVPPCETGPGVERPVVPSSSPSSMPCRAPSSVERAVERPMVPRPALCRIPVYRGDVARRLPAWLGHPNHGGHFGRAKRYGSGIITDCKFRQFREPAPPAAGQRVGSGGRVANRPSAPEISYGSGIITAGNFPLKQSPAPSA